MLHSHQFRFPEASAKATPAAERGLLRALMLPFEVLHRQCWSAPWE